MPNNIRHDTVHTDMAALKARLTRLENSPQLGNSSILNGSLEILDALGRVLMVLGKQPDGTIGVASYDPTTNVKLVMLGQLAPASTAYGLTVRNAAGTMQQVAGILGDFAAGSQSTASGTPVSFSDGPTVTATIGPSGQALVSIGAYILTSTAGVPNDVVAAVDGVVPRDGGGIPLLDVEGLTSTYGQAVIGGLTPGSHVFTHQYYAGGAVTATYLHRQLTVVPL